MRLGCRVYGGPRPVVEWVYGNPPQPVVQGGRIQKDDEGLTIQVLYQTSGHHPNKQEVGFTAWTVIVLFFW